MSGLKMANRVRRKDAKKNEEQGTRITPITRIQRLRTLLVFEILNYHRGFDEHAQIKPGFPLSRE
jgi:hypothetical protein